MHVYLCMCTHIHTYIQREREREGTDVRPYLAEVKHIFLDLKMVALDIANKSINKRVYCLRHRQALLIKIRKK